MKDNLKNCETNYNLDQELVKLRFLFMRTVSEIWKSESKKVSETEHSSEGKIYYDFIDKINRVEKSELFDVLESLLSIGQAHGWTSTLNKLKSELENFTTQSKSFSRAELVSIIEKQEIEKELRNTLINRTLRHLDEKIGYNLREFNKSITQMSNERLTKLISLIKKNGHLRGFIESLNPLNIQRYFFCAFKEYTPFANFGIQIIKPTARWNYYGDNQWTKPNTEALYISIPSNIKSQELAGNDQNYEEFNYEFDKAEILTQYYQNFPSFFGKTSDLVSIDVASENNEVIERSVNSFYNDRKFKISLNEKPFTPKFDDTTLEVYTGKNLQTNPSGNDYDLGLSQNTFLGFGAVLMKMISILWENEDLRDKLDYAQRMKNETSLLCGLDSVSSIHELNYILSSFVSHEKVAELHAFNLKYDNELKAIFMQHFDYECPWVFNIRLLSPDVDTYKLDDLSSVYDNNMSILNLTTIEVPHTPDQKDISSVTMALARYNATGPAYPFSCS
ncbi:hypothetical protein [Pseudoalteromonas umbrosa]|uniref:hypothetical protein n=1 Tax=Pseudoalteromonas umbrosa TaxID=3048489 RepID=UPI0024C41D42|nr:hypothetical protein [Pseudoalteromonas sp. B95]MDK1286112.1 hypothetical protein [Pseudoalteromonas sp. B95]